MQEFPDQPEQPVLQARLERQEFPDQLEQPVLQAQREKLVLPVPLAQLVLQAPLVNKVQLELQELQARLEKQAKQVHQALQEQLV